MISARALVPYLMVALTAACAQSRQDASSSASSIIETRSDPAFGDAGSALRKLVAASRIGPTGPQHFCIVGYRGAEGKYAWVHWREPGRLIFWLGGGDDATRDNAFLESPRELDLSKDVVADARQLEGSSYRVTRDWVRRTLADCASRGTQYVIAKQ